MTASTAHAIDLTDALEAAVATHESAAVAVATARVARGELRTTSGGLLPTLVADADVGRLETWGDTQPQSTTTAGAGVALDVPLLDLELLARRAAARATSEAAQLDVDDALAGLRRDTADAYVALLAARDAVPVAQQVVEVQRGLVSLAEARLAAGYALGADVELARLALEQAELALELDRSAIEQSRLVLERLTGWAELDPAALEWPSLTGVQEHRDTAGVMAAAARAGAARDTVRALRLELAPTLAAAGRWGIDRRFATSSTSQTATASLVLRWEIFGPTRLGRQAVADARAEVASIALDAVTRDEALARAVALARLGDASLRYAVAQRSAEVARSTLDLVQTQYELGGATIFDALRAAETLASAERSVVSARAAVELAAIGQIAAAGGFEDEAGESL